MKTKISSNKQFNHIENNEIFKCIRTNNALAEYHVFIEAEFFAIVGFVPVNDHYCIIDLHNKGIDSITFLKWLNKTIRQYPNTYCIPNNQGALIWNAFGFRSENIYIIPSASKLFSKWKFRFLKFGFLNMFFKITTNKGIKIPKKIYYSKSIPDYIWLDTF